MASDEAIWGDTFWAYVLDEPSEDLPTDPHGFHPFDTFSFDGTSSNDENGEEEYLLGVYGTFSDDKDVPVSQSYSDSRGESIETAPGNSSSDGSIHHVRSCRDVVSCKEDRSSPMFAAATRLLRLQGADPSSTKEKKKSPFRLFHNDKTPRVDFVGIEERNPSSDGRFHYSRSERDNADQQSDVTNDEEGNNSPSEEITMGRESEIDDDKPTRKEHSSNLTEGRDPRFNKWNGRANQSGIKWKSVLPRSKRKEPAVITCEDDGTEVSLQKRSSCSKKGFYLPIASFRGRKKSSRNTKNEQIVMSASNSTEYSGDRVAERKKMVHLPRAHREMHIGDGGGCAGPSIANLVCFSNAASKRQEVEVLGVSKNRIESKKNILAHDGSRGRRTSSELLPTRAASNRSRPQSESIVKNYGYNKTKNPSCMKYKECRKAPEPFLSAQKDTPCSRLPLHKRRNKKKTVPPDIDKPHAKLFIHIHEFDGHMVEEKISPKLA